MKRKPRNHPPVGSAAGVYPNRLWPGRRLKNFISLLTARNKMTEET